MANHLLSLAGLVGSPIIVDARAARVADVVARSGRAYPEITGLVVRAGRRTVFVPTAAIEGLTGDGGLRTRTPESNLEAFARRPGDVLLAADVLDRQIVDADGVQVVRAADLYLAPLDDVLRLVALDTSVRALVRRLSPRRPAPRWAQSRWAQSRWTRPRVPRRVIDWNDLGELTDEPDVLTLTGPVASVRHIHGRDLTSALTSTLITATLDLAS